MTDTEQPGPDGPSRTRVLLLGSAELSRELVIALQRLGAETIAVDRRPDAPLHSLADQSLVIDPADTEELAATIRWLQPKCVLVAGDAAGALSADALVGATDNGITELMPSVRGVRLTADAEGLRRLAADELGLPTAPFWFVGSAEELRAVAEHAGLPMVVKPVAATGAGQSVMVRPDDVEPAWQRAVAAGGSRALAETVVEVDAEITLLVACTAGPNGPALEFCAPIGHRSIESGDGQLVTEFWQPHPMSKPALDAARSIAARVVRAFGGRGLFGVDLLIHGDEVYFTGATARPYDAVWVTLRTQRLSGFELQARAILGLPVDTIMISPGAARLRYSAPQPAAGQPDAVPVLPQVLAVPETDVMVFGHHEGHPRRRLAVTVATGTDVTTASRRAEQASDALGGIWRPTPAAG